MVLVSPLVGDCCGAALTAGQNIGSHFIDFKRIIFIEFMSIYSCMFDNVIRLALQFALVMWAYWLAFRVFPPISAYFEDENE